jgi:hypothetical protein
VQANLNYVFAEPNDYQDEIYLYFYKEKGIDLQADMSTAIGPNSEFTTLIDQLDATLDPAIAGNNTLMSMEQWSTGSLLSDPAYGLANFTAYYSTFYTGMNFVYYPEYSIARAALCSDLTDT